MEEGPACLRKASPVTEKSQTPQSQFTGAITDSVSSTKGKSGGLEQKARMVSSYMCVIFCMQEFILELAAGDF